MGLLDWLTSSIGSDLSPITPPSVERPGMPPPLPPGGNTITATPLRQPPPGSPELGNMDPMAAGGTSPTDTMDPMGAGYGPPPTPAPPVPLPQPRPPGAPAPNANPDPAALPPNARPLSLASPPQMSPGLGQPQGGGILAQALGISPERESRLRSSLAAGLKSVGENYKKPGLAAFAGSAGSAMEGEQKREDTTYDQKIKALQQAVAAKAKNDDKSYKDNYLKYLNREDRGKSGAWNKPDSQRFIDAMNALSSDRDIVAAQKTLDQALKDGDPKKVAAAQAAHQKLTQEKQAFYLSGVNLDPKQIEFNIKTPPGTPPTIGADGKMAGGNPHKIMSEADFDRYVKPGQAYINPRDGKVYIRKGADGTMVPAGAGGNKSED